MTVRFVFRHFHLIRSRVFHFHRFRFRILGRLRMYVRKFAIERVGFTVLLYGGGGFVRQSLLSNCHRRCQVSQGLYVSYRADRCREWCGRLLRWSFFCRVAVSFAGVALVWQEYDLGDALPRWVDIFCGCGGQRSLSGSEHLFVGRLFPPLRVAQLFSTGGNCGVNGAKEFSLSNAML